MGEKADVNIIFSEAIKLVQETRDILKEINLIVQNLPTKDFVIGKLEVLEEKLKNAYLNTHNEDAKKIMDEIHSYIKELRKKKKISKNTSAYEDLF